MRRFVGHRRWVRARNAAIAIQCSVRCFQAYVANYCLSRAFFKKNKQATVVIQALACGAIQCPRFRFELKERQEEAKLKNQLKTLQRKLEEAEL
jgi:uncharacterized membrane protein YciS (DUF1049 family)